MTIREICAPLHVHTAVEARKMVNYGPQFKIFFKKMFFKKTFTYRFRVDLHNKPRKECVQQLAHL